MEYIIILILIGYFIYRWYTNNKEKFHNNRATDYSNGKNRIEENHIDIQQDKNNHILELTKSPFLMAHSLLTKAEMNFYKILKDAIEDTHIICPKVRMLDVLWTKTYHVKDKGIFLSKVNRKHFDFVICDIETLKPLFAIELDDKSHEEEERKERDKFVDELFESLNFNVIHIPVRYSYDLNVLKEKIKEATCNQKDICTVEEIIQ